MHTLATNIQLLSLIHSSGSIEPIIQHKSIDLHVTVNVDQIRSQKYRNIINEIAHMLPLKLMRLTLHQP